MKQTERASGSGTARRRVAGSLAAAAALSLLMAACGGGAQGPSADLVLRNGKVVTVDSANPQAQAIAIAGDSILAVGSNADIDKYVGDNTKVIDLQGKLATPGFIESHGHYMGLGTSLTEIDLLGAKTWSEIVSKVDSAVKQARPGQWIQGRGWNQGKWIHPPAHMVQGFPTNEGLNRVAPNNPVVLGHASGHALMANAAALKAAGIGRNTPDPAGGTIRRDANGNATGMLVDNAQRLIRKALQASQKNRSPQQVRQEEKHHAVLAAKRSLSRGITTFDDMGESFATLDLLKQMVDSAELPPIRLYLYVGQSEVTPANEQELVNHYVVGADDDHYTVRSIGEVTADGALGSRSAWFLKPYSDLHSSTGLNVTTPARIKQIAEIGLKHGFQISSHAIGDRANREVLNVYESIFKEHNLDGDTLRWRIDHAQHLSPQDIPRFGQMGVIAAMQGIHACSDWPFVIARIGYQRAKEGAYVWQKLWKSGALVTNGTDTPVERVDPIPSFHCSVSREMVGTDSIFFPDQRLSRQQALETYTINGAIANFDENRLGTLTPGKLADVVVWDKDIMTVPQEQILGTKPVYTIVGGKIAYQAPDASTQSGQE